MTAPTLPPAAPEAPPRARTPRRRQLGAASREAGQRLRSAGVLRRPWLLGIMAAAWAAAIGLAVAAVPLLLAWMTSTSSGLTWPDALRFSGLLWVVAHGAPMTLAGVTYSLMPWGLVLVPLLLLGYAGGWAGRRSDARGPRDLSLLVLPAALVYSFLVTLVAALTGSPTAHVPLPMAAASALVVAVLGLGWGAVRAAGFGLDSHLPGWLAVSIRAGVAAAFTLVALGALAATAALALHFDDAVTIAQSLGAGAGGGLVLLALGVAYVPVLAMWGTAYVMGAGVVIGPAITVSPFVATTAPTQLPPFPLLAALPQGSAAVAWLLPLSGVLAGVVAGLVIARQARKEQRLVRLALSGLAAAIGGAVLGLGSVLASGSLGDLRLAQIGPVPLTVAVLGAVLIALGAAPSAVVPAPPARPRLSVANDDVAPGTVDDEPS